MTVNRKIIEIDEELCDGCGNCVPSCAEGALQIVDGKARLVAEVYCDGLGACLGECPQGALNIVERQADEFDEKAVEERLISLSGEEKQELNAQPAGCPSAQLKSFARTSPAPTSEMPSPRQNASSELAHWPVQIRLVPPTAPFLKGADLLVAADCTPVAYPNFHRDFLKGKAVMVGCPKFDDAQEYIRKFSEIFKTADIKSVTVVVMEVPCCQGLPIIVEKGLEMSGKKIPMEKIVISARGNILRSEKLAA
jgi:Fe-S-cluster-containing hydrogenase component 2